MKQVNAESKFSPASEMTSQTYLYYHPRGGCGIHWAFTQTVTEQELKICCKKLDLITLHGSEWPSPKVCKQQTLHRAWRTELATLLLKCKLLQSLWRTARRFLKKLKLEHEPAIPLLGLYPEKDENSNPKKICTLTATAALFKQ